MDDHLMIMMVSKRWQLWGLVWGCLTIASMDTPGGGEDDEADLTLQIWHLRCLVERRDKHHLDPGLLIAGTPKSHG